MKSIKFVCLKNLPLVFVLGIQSSGMHKEIIVELSSNNNFNPGCQCQILGTLPLIISTFLYIDCPITYTKHKGKHICKICCMKYLLLNIWLFLLVNFSLHVL